MSEFKHIDVPQTKTMIDSTKLTIVDIRDEKSYQAAHIPNAIHLTNDTLSAFIAKADLSLPLVVVCYHGNSSQGAAQFLAQQGFADVYSMDGGFSAWSRIFPTCVEK